MMTAESVLSKHPVLRNTVTSKLCNVCQLPYTPEVQRCLLGTVYIFLKTANLTLHTDLQTFGIGSNGVPTQA